MKHWNLKRVLSLLLVVCMVTGLLSGVSAMAEDQTANYHEISTDGLTLATEDNAAADETETEEAPYADTDVVRVFVVLEDKPVLQQGYATRGIAGNAAAMAVSKALEAKQAALAAEISANVLSGETLNVHWNLTLAANAMSVDLPYGKMDEVEALKGNVHSPKAALFSYAAVEMSKEISCYSFIPSCHFASGAIFNTSI